MPTEFIRVIGGGSSYEAKRKKTKVVYAPGPQNANLTSKGEFETLGGGKRPKTSKASSGGSIFKSRKPAASGSESGSGDPINWRRSP